MKQNPLLEILKIAHLNKSIIDQHPEFNYSIDGIIVPVPKESVEESFERYGNKTLYDTKELAGIAGMFNSIQKSKVGKVIYSNDLGSQIRGIDCIAIVNNKKVYCEAKGTIVKNINLSKFLRKTKTKGRQMSWQWIWSSLVDFAEDSRNANVFLENYRNIIRMEDIERKIFISKLEKIKGKYAIQYTMEYGENEISKLRYMNEFPKSQILNKWLDDIES
jgi:hypothetical protein